MKICLTSKNCTLARLDKLFGPEQTDDTFDSFSLTSVYIEMEEKRILRNFFTKKFGQLNLSENMPDFKNCTLAQLDKLFGLEQTTLRHLKHGLTAGHQILTMPGKTLRDHVHDWNEADSAFHRACVRLVNFSGRKFGLFAQRPFAGVVEGTEMSGTPDGMIASGFRVPEKPYFCFQEYKRETDPNGDPAGQTLAAMPVAQDISEHRHPVYGCYVRGQLWFFMILEGKEYCIGTRLRPPVMIFSTSSVF